MQPAIKKKKKRSKTLALLGRMSSVLRDLCHDYLQICAFLETCRLIAAINDESHQGSHAGFTISLLVSPLHASRFSLATVNNGDLLRESLLQRLANKGIGFLDSSPFKLPSEMLTSFASALADESSSHFLEPQDLILSLSCRLLLRKSSLLPAIPKPSCMPRTASILEIRCSQRLKKKRQVSFCISFSHTLSAAPLMHTSHRWPCTILTSIATPFPVQIKKEDTLAEYHATFAKNRQRLRCTGLQ